MPLPPVIAIVEDDSEMRDALCELLQVESFACRMFENAEAFLAVHARGLFAAVITDVRMPGISGLELLAILKRSDPDLPVIVVTSSVDARTRRRALEAGARAVLLKPVRGADLLSHLTAIVR